VRRELFGTHFPLGEWVRIGDRRFRVVGVLAPKGEFVGLNMDDLVIIPVASAQAVFNLRSLLRIGVTVPRREEVRRVSGEIRRVLRERHNGEEDITILTEDALSSAFDRILLALTLALGGIAAISLGVAGILIMNVMLIAVSQRTSEIGLLKAIGASPQQIRFIFFAEAGVLSAVGAIVGSVLGQIGSFVIRQIYPSVPAFAPSWAIVAALLIALATGIGFSVLPARRAARLDAALALARR
jgi:putative ABC transport system permease protein